MRQTAQPNVRALGAFVRERRLALGLTQTELADRLGYVQERISLIENGKYGMPSVPALAGIARALEVGLSDILAAAGYSEFIVEPEAREPAGQRTASSGATGAAAMKHFIQESGRLAVSL